MLSSLKGFFAPTVSADDSLAKVDEVLPLPDGSVAEAKYLLTKLTPWSEDEALNAKTRRRVKRIVSRLTETYPGLDLTAPEPEVDAPKPSRAVSLPAYGDLDATKACSLFQTAISASQIEGILNCLVGPTTESKTSADWQKLKSVLFTVLANRRITNKNIRRRIGRLIFVLASESDLARLNELKKEAQESGPMAKTTPRSAQNSMPLRGARGPAVAVPTPVAAAPPAEVAVDTVPVIVKSIDECLKELSTATSASDVDTAISAVSANSKGTSDARAELKAQLERLADDTVMVSNTKVKRKVLRLIKTLEGMVDEPPKVATTGGSTVDKEAQRIAAEAAATAAAAASKASSVAVDAGGIEGIVRQLRDVRSAEQLDAVLITLDMRTVLPAEAAEGGCGTEQGAPTSGNDGADHRRLLKRSIEQVLSQEDVAASMNAKVRRRVSRITSALTTEGEEAGDAANAAGEVSTTTAMDVSEIPGTGAIASAPMKKVPYVVFVGNLSYDTTSADIESHLRETAALEGPIVVRLRTNPATKQSIGVAFVDLEGARELHQCIGAAHHSTLHGRIINVEKSCGGRNKAQRGEKIANKRTEQQARAQEAVNKVLTQFEQRGVLQNVHKWGPTLKDSVYAHSPAHLTQVLEAYGGLPKTEQRIQVLLQLLTDRKQQGHAQAAAGDE